MMSICLLMEVKRQWALLVWMGDRLSSTPAVGCVSVAVSLCPQTFVNSSAQIVPLMALHSCWETKTPFGIVCHGGKCKVKLTAEFCLHSRAYTNCIIQT